MNKLHTVEAVTQLIQEGKQLLLAGSEAALDQLPAGRWIGGTIPYFMGDEGGVIDRGSIYVDVLPDEVEDIRVKSYNAEALPELARDAFEEGFAVIILPASSEVHLSYAQGAPDFPDLFMQPIVGWIAGVHLDDLGAATPKVYDGAAGRKSADEAVILFAKLKEGVAASVHIINLFAQSKADELIFEETGFEQREVLVNGARERLSDYLERVGHDQRLPLVADYFGAMINVSIQAVSEDKVDFYAPVFAGVKYNLATPVEDYISAFEAQLPSEPINPVFSCNCILNFLYSDLEGKQTGDLKGPITFGEVAYQLLNQTLVYLRLEA